MRTIYMSVFGITLLLGWLFFGWFGDFNMYVVPPNGSTWIKQHATLADRIISGFLIGLVFAALDTLALWLWQRFRTRRDGLPSALDKRRVPHDEHTV